MPQTPSFGRFATKIRDVLLGAGLDGIDKYTLGQKCRTRIFSVKDMDTVLEAWENAGLIERFNVRVYGTRKSVMVRATDELLHNWAQPFESDPEEFSGLMDR